MRLRVEEVEDGTEERTVLKVVLGQGDCTKKDGKHLIERKSGSVFEYQSRDSTNGVITSIELSRWSVAWDVEQGAVCSEEVEVLRAQVHRRMLNKQPRGESSVGLDLWLGVRQRAEKEVQERTGVLSDGTLESCDNFG